MNLRDLDENRKRLIETTCEDYEHLVKIQDSEGWVVSEVKNKSEKSAVSNICDAELTKKEARDLITIIDFMQVAQCDQITCCWQSDTVKLLVLLKKRYFSCFGESVYA